MMTAVRTVAYASGKVILFGEHAVVYGRPAIAVPVTQVQAMVTVEPRDGDIVLAAPDLGRCYPIAEAEPDDPLAFTVLTALEYLGLGVDQYLMPKAAPRRTETESRACSGGTLSKLRTPFTGPYLMPKAAPRRAETESRACSGGTLSKLRTPFTGQGLTVTISSTIPVARGLGSSAATSAAIVRALARHFGQTLSPAQVSELVYRTEVLQHGTPSGIDNSVVAFEQPVYFVRGQPIEYFRVGAPLHLVIADTGIASATKEAVGAVRAAWERDRVRYEGLFDEIGDIAREARCAIEEGAEEQLGRLMDANHRLLQAIEVSSPELDRLVEAARSAGALGAKLSGGGRGGNMIALVRAETQEQVAAVLGLAGAEGVIVTEVPGLASAG